MAEKSGIYTMKGRPIIIVEDDEDDCEMLLETFREVGVPNEFRCFSNPELALKYLKDTSETPFLIISDINMPKMDGLLFKKAINDDPILQKRNIPFIIMSTSKDGKLVQTAFGLHVQGYFKKASDIQTLKKMATTIILYWNQGTFHL